MTTLILVRHGQSEANLNEIFAGQYDAELSDLGRKQAQKTAEYIFENYKLDKAYSSNLKRAYETGQYIADLFGLDVETDRDLGEINAGKWDGVGYDEIKEKYEDAFGLWFTDIGNARCTDGEAVAELGKRVMASLEKIAKENDGKNVLIATHATPIRASQSIILTGSVQEMKNINWTSNASVTVYEYEDGKWEIVRVSEDKHLGELKTELPKKV